MRPSQRALFQTHPHVWKIPKHLAIAQSVRAQDFTPLQPLSEAPWLSLISCFFSHLENNILICSENHLPSTLWHGSQMEMKKRKLYLSQQCTAVSISHLPDKGASQKRKGNQLQRQSKHRTIVSKPVFQNWIWWPHLESQHLGGRGKRARVWGQPRPYIARSCLKTTKCSVYSPTREQHFCLIEQ
jgi:hypothetical protein